MNRSASLARPLSLSLSLSLTLVASSLLASPAWSQVGPLPVIEPGSGWTGAWTPNVVTGNCQEAVPIAHWDRLPDQILWRDDDNTFALGVIAYHREGIDSVDFAVEGGTVVSITDWAINNQTGHYAYVVGIDPADFTDSQAYEVRARVVPDGPGTERILTWSFFDGGSLERITNYAEFWVDSVNGSDTAVGSTGNPFLTVGKAFQEIASFTPSSPITGFGNQDGAIVNLVFRNPKYEIDGALATIDNDWPVTIRTSRTQGGKAFLWPQRGSNLTNGGAYMNARSLLLQDLQVEVSNSNAFDDTTGATTLDIFRVNSTLGFHGEASLFFSACELLGHEVSNYNDPLGVYVLYSTLANGLRSGAHLIEPTSYRAAERQATRVFIEDSNAFAIRGNHALRQVGWLRNVLVDLCNLGAFVDVEAVIDSAAQRDQSPVPDQADSNDPTYAWTIHGEYMADNALCDSVEAWQTWNGWAFLIHGTDDNLNAPDSNFAVVNSLFLPVPDFEDGNEALVTRDSGAVTRHVVLQHVTVAGYPIAFDGTDANGRDDFPCSLLDASISTGVDARDTTPTGCVSTTWEGVKFENDFIHEAYPSTSTVFNWCSSWSSENLFNTFTSLWQVKSTSGAHVVDVIVDGLRHKYALHAALRNINASGFTAVGARRKVGE